MRVKIVIVVGVAVGLMSCRTVKKMESESIALNRISAQSETVNEQYSKQTFHFGDTLNASVFTIERDSLQADSTEVESKGVKTKVKVKPVFNAAGKRIGSKIDIQSISKPVIISNEQAMQQSNSGSTENLNLVVEAQEQTTTTSPMNYYKWGCVVGVFIVLVLFRKKIRSLIF